MRDSVGAPTCDQNLFSVVCFCPLASSSLRCARSFRACVCSNSASIPFASEYCRHRRSSCTQRSLPWLGVISGGISNSSSSESSITFSLSSLSSLRACLIISSSPPGNLYAESPISFSATGFSRSSSVGRVPRTRVWSRSLSTWTISSFSTAASCGSVDMVSRLREQEGDGMGVRYLGYQWR
ncbi:hypothetical protein K466DRAFT_241847 [Polyporus arcularius HHB13444]|uniref:Uncharacterized protein n=1 Tax=Polyporus arcularius HHB13444 TaxID=1314778 RepID=A0A5C3P2R2_9APHY|nr:hypothetical protein K466DRAFT_241847 [Polyporus arcularius HHB13444]